MVKGILIVNSYGALIYNRIRREAFDHPITVDGIIVLGSTIYTVMELLGSVGLCLGTKKYRRLSICCEWGSITALRTPTRTLFVLIHDKEESLDYIYHAADRVYKRYVDEAVLSHSYTLDEQIGQMDLGFMGL